MCRPRSARSPRPSWPRRSRARSGATWWRSCSRVDVRRGRLRRRRRSRRHRPLLHRGGHPNGPALPRPRGRRPRRWRGRRSRDGARVLSRRQLEQRLGSRLRPPRVAPRRAGRGHARAARAAGPALRWSWEEVRGVFEELYNGSAVAAERYGVAPRLHLAHGLAAEETVLLERRGLEDLAALGITKIGVVTGRTAADFAQVRARLPFGEGLAVATDDDGHKPDPALLARVMTALDARGALAVGDTLDDLRMAQRYARTALGRERPVTPVILCGPDEVDAYRAAGARHFIRRVGELPALARTVGA
ncbi:MAG: HAD family hydrolase [Chloroflexi bacterium]|nr:MAG: HAD family hydrolase [Chloroflexota bacterium]